MHWQTAVCIASKQGFVHASEDIKGRQRSGQHVTYPLEYRAYSAGYVFFLARSPLAPITTMLRVMLPGTFPSKVSRRLHVDAKADSCLR